VPVIREQEQWKPGLSKALPVLPWKWDRQSESMKASKQRYERAACETISGGNPQPPPIQRKIQNADE
jgi:hypothetical protein